MATYYIDFASGSDSNNGTAKGTAWQRHPYMTGWAGSYSHSAGDIFIFKGGVTWTSGCYPWVIGASGTAGNIDTYTIDLTWYTGGSWAQPIFDDNHLSASGGMLNATTKSYLTFNNFTFTNYGTTLTYDQTQALDFLDCHDLAFTNLTLTTLAQRSIYIHFNTTGTYHNFTLDSIDCSHTCSLLWFACGGGTVVTDGLTITNTWIHDFSDKIGGDAINNTHGDGFIHIFGSGFTVTADCHNNIATGDFRRGYGTVGAMTGFYFAEQSTVNWIIYNTVLSPSPVQASMFDAYIVLNNPSGTIQLYNNTLNNSNLNLGLGFHTNNTGTYIFKNNIVTGFQYAVFHENTGGTLTTNYNLYNSSSGQLVYGASFQSYATWQGAGRDVNGILGTAPTFTNAPSDVTLASGAGIGTGTDLSGIFTTDKNGATRAIPWWMGAYQTASGAITNGIKRIGKYLRLYGPAA